MKFFLFILILNSLTAVAQRPEINVSFKLEEEFYKIAFINQRSYIEKETAKRIIPALNQYLCFADFKRGADAQNDFTITLDNRSRSDNRAGLHDMVFFFELAGLQVQNHAPVEPWLFLDRSAYRHHTDDANAFIDQMVETFTGMLSVNYHRLAERLFSHVSLTREAASLKDKAGWQIPSLRCLDEGSALEVVVEKRNTPQRTLCRYLGRVENSGSSENPNGFIKSVGDDHCGIFSSETQASATAVYLKRFKRKLPEMDSPERAGDVSSAFMAARREVDEAPYREPGWRKLLHFYKEGLMAFYDLERALEYAYRCSGYGHGALGLEFLEIYIQNNYHADADADLALAHWANLAAENGLLSPVRLSALPSTEQWPGEANRTLRQVVESESATPHAIDKQSFWLSPQPLQSGFTSSCISDVTAKILQTRGDLLYAAGIVEEAVAFYERGLETARGSGSSQLPPAYFEIAAKLADIYHLYPAADPGRVKFRRLMIDSIPASDPAFEQVLQNYHAALADVYIRRGVWVSAGPNNARAQLEKALACDTQKFCPYMRQTLAEGYLSRLQRKDLAAGEFLRVVRDYLMTGNYEAAENNLTKAIYLKNFLEKPERKELEVYEDIIDLKKTMQNEYPEEDVKKLSGRLRKTERHFKKLNSPHAQDIAFRMLSELASQYPDKSRALLSYHYALRAAENRRTLTSYSDLRHIQSIAAFMSESVEFEETEVVGIRKYNPFRKMEESGSGEKRRYRVDLNRNLSYAVVVDRTLFEAASAACYFAEREYEKIPHITVGRRVIEIRLPEASEKTKKKTIRHLEKRFPDKKINVI